MVCEPGNAITVGETRNGRPITVTGDKLFKIISDVEFGMLETIHTSPATLEATKKLSLIFCHVVDYPYISVATQYMGAISLYQLSCRFRFSSYADYKINIRKYLTEIMFSVILNEQTTYQIYLLNVRYIIRN